MTLLSAEQLPELIEYHGVSNRAATERRLDILEGANTLMANAPAEAQPLWAIYSRVFEQTEPEFWEYCLSPRNLFNDVWAGKNKAVFFEFRVLNDRGTADWLGDDFDEAGDFVRGTRQPLRITRRDGKTWSPQNQTWER